MRMLSGGFPNQAVGWVFRWTASPVACAYSASSTVVPQRRNCSLSPRFQKNQVLPLHHALHDLRLTIIPGADVQLVCAEIQAAGRSQWQILLVLQESRDFRKDAKAVPRQTSFVWREAEFFGLCRPPRHWSSPCVAPAGTLLQRLQQPFARCCQESCSHRGGRGHVLSLSTRAALGVAWTHEVVDSPPPTLGCQVL